MREITLASVLALAAVTGATAASQPDTGAPPPYGAPIELDQAKWVAQAAESKAETLGLSMVIVVVGPSGDTVILERMRGVSEGSIDIATLKARSAAMYRTSTKTMADTRRTGVDFGSFAGALPVEGGAPLVSGGRIIGGVGVSGGAPDQDGDIAQAASEAIQ